MGTPASVGVHCYIPEKLIAWNWNTVIAYSMLGTKWNNDQSGRIDGHWVCDAEPVFQTQQTCATSACAILILSCLIWFLLDLYLANSLLIYGSFFSHFQFITDYDKRNYLLTVILSLHLTYLIFLKKSVNRNRDIHFLNTWL